MSLQSRLALLISAIGADVKRIEAKSTVYPKAVYELTAGQTLANVPGDFPASGLVFRRLS